MLVNIGQAVKCDYEYGSVSETSLLYMSGTEMSLI